jgi:putative MATE family efflux protein
MTTPVDLEEKIGKWNRFRDALPGKRKGATTNEGVDRLILTTSIPSMINLAVPIVNSVDTFWVGRMGNALALAGQAAANQVFFTIFFLVNYLPTITAPLVAAAVGSGNDEEARQRVCESIFLSNLLGALGTLLLVGFPATALGMILPKGAPALEYATPYLALRALSMVPALFSATGFATFRGLLDTVTPLKVSLGTNLLNLVLDPLLIFASPLGFVGAALATAISEAASGLTYLRLLLKRNLVTPALILRPPSWKSLRPLLQGGASMLGRQLALNIGLVSAARRAQSMDPTGVSAAAYGIVMQMYSVGIVVHVAMQGTCAALVPSTLARSGKDEARRVADRIFIWGSIVGVLLGLTQFLALPFLVPVFSTLPEVQEAVRAPALLASILHVINGPVFAGEGALLGLGCYRDLMLITAAGIATMVACLTSPLGKRLDGILLSLMAFCSLQAVAVVVHYLKIGPLAVRWQKSNKAAGVVVTD